MFLSWSKDFYSCSVSLDIAQLECKVIVTAVTMCSIGGTDLVCVWLVDVGM